MTAMAVVGDKALEETEEEVRGTMDKGVEVSHFLLKLTTAVLG